MYLCSLCFSGLRNLERVKANLVVLLINERRFLLNCEMQWARVKSFCSAEERTETADIFSEGWGYDWHR